MAAATFVRLAVDPIVVGSQFATYNLAILFSALCGGICVGLFAMALSLLPAWYFFLAPHYTGLSGGEAYSMVAFILAGAPVVYAIGLLQNAGATIQEARLRAAVAEERARAADELQRWKDIFDSIPIGIYVLDPSLNTIVLANPAFLSMHGLPEQDYIGTSLYDLHPQSDAGGLTAVVRTCQDAGSVHGEHIHCRKDGTTFPVRYHGATIRDTTGRILYMIGSVIDITAERELETRLTDMFDNAAFGIGVVDPASNIIRLANPAYAAFHNMSVTDVQGRSIFDMYRPLDREGIANLNATADREGSVEFEVERLRNDGSTFPARMHITSVRAPDGAIRYRIATVQDITAQRELEHLWTDVIEHSRLAIGVDEPGDPPRLRLCNDAYAALHSMSVKEMNGSSVYDFYPPQERERAAEFLAAADAGGHVEFEADRLHKDGSSFPARVHITSVQEPSDGVRYRIVSVQDISQERAMDAQLRQSQRLEAIGQLSAGVAHDFNNLLQGIISHLELIEDDSVSPATQQKVDTVIRLAEEGGKLSQQLLSFARKQLLVPQDIELHDFLEDFSQMLSRTLNPKIRVELRITPDLRTLSADPTHLRSALLNVAINARDAMPSGGNLILEAGYTNSSNDTVAFRITDTGTGMAPDVLSMVCEPFFSTKGPNGTGLGLSMVLGFAKQSGGDLHISSALGTGTCVELSLPVHSNQMRAAA